MMSVINRFGLNMRLSFADIALLIQLAVIQVKKGDNIALTLSGNDVHGNSVECNSNITLMCKAGAATDTMSWHRNGIKIGDCTFGLCSLTPSASSIYRFDYDTTSGEFNISARPVTYADSHADFKCSIGAESKSLMLNVTGDFSIHPSTKTVGSNMTELNISTGCIDKTVDVQFQWSIINATNQTDVKDLPKSYQDLIVLNSLSCFSDPNCGGMDKEKKISTLSFEEDTSTTDGYFIAITVKYGQYPNKSSEFQFKERLFKIKEKAVPVHVISPTCFELVWCIILVVLAVITIVISLVVLIIWSLVRCKNKVDDIPDMPTYFKLVPGSITETSATFSWISGNHPTGKQTCVLCYKPLNNDTTTREKLKVMTNEVTQKKIDNLEPGSKYRCYVYAKNSKGASNYTDHIDFVTLGRPDKPTKFKITIVTENSLSLCWKPGLYSKYDQSFILKYTNKKTDKIETVDIPGKTVKHLLTPLAEGIKYELVLYAKNKYGESDGAGPLIQTTKGLPETPTDVQLVSFDEKTITIEWKSGKYRKYQQTFVICFRLKSPRGIPWKNETAKDQDDELLQHTVINLKEGSTYELKIFAWNKLGYSDPSETLIIETKGKPEAPSDLRVVERRSKSIAIGWKPGEYRRDTQKFVVNFRRVGREGKVNKWKQKEVVDDGITSSFEFNIGDLVANKLYHISINSTNRIGSSTMSDVLTVRTNPLLPQPPTEFMCQNVSEYTAQVSWKPKYYKQTKQSFLLRWAKLTDKTQISKIIKFNNKSKTVDYNIADLSPGTDYELCVWSFFEDLEGRRISESCKVLEITTKEKTADENDE